MLELCKKNKSDIPSEFQANKTRPIRLTLFGFDKDTTLVLFVPKKLKSGLLVFTMHHDDKIDDQTGKPDINCSNLINWCTFIYLQCIFGENFKKL